jgi:hypothetical protein
MDLNDREHRRQVLSLLPGPASRVGEDVSERLNSTIDALLPWAYSPPAALKRRGLKTTLTLILFTESLDVRLTVRIEEFLAALMPRGFEFGRCDVPVRPAFLRNGT